MIPKVIHYCWFGGAELPNSVKKCIESWKKYCPNYEIKRWDESNYDISTKCPFVRKAYEEKKWAFVSDYARLDIIHQFGGVYLDTDVELIASLDSLFVEGRGFFGFEKNNVVASGLGFSSNKGNVIISEMMDVYHNLQFDVAGMEKISCPVINTRIFLEHGLILDGTTQVVEDFTVFNTSYLCPYSIYTGRCEMKNNTVSIHHYDASWMTKKSLLRLKVIIAVKRVLPRSMVKKIQRTVNKRSINKSGR